MTVIKHKRGSGAPDPSGLDVGELAIDLAGATLYTKIGGSIVELGGGGGTGAGMVISATEPTEKITGMQWLNTVAVRLYFHDDGKWLEVPYSQYAGSGDGGDSKPEGYEETKADASGAMSVGDMVVLNDDGTVSAVAEAAIPPGPGTPEAFNNGEASFISSIYDPASNKVVIVYRDGGNSNCGTAVLGTVSGGSITFGTPVVFNNQGTWYTSCTYDSASNKVVIAYRDDGNSYYGTAIVGTVSGDSITFGAPEVFNSNGNTEKIVSTYDPVNNKVVIIYSDMDNGRYGTAIVGTVSGDSISFSTPTVFNSRAVDSISSTYDSTANKIVIAYLNDPAGTAIVGTVSGNSISFGAPAVFRDKAKVNATSITYETVARKVVIAYQDAGNSYYGTAIVGTVSGNSIAFGTPVVFQAANSTLLSSTYDSTANKTVIAYQNRSTGRAGSLVAGTVSGESITFDALEDFHPNAQAYSCTYDPLNGEVVIAYNDQITKVGNAVPYALEGGGGTATNLTHTNFIGVSGGNYADGSEATVQIAGINADQRRMTVGKQYIQPDGSLDIAEGDPSVEAGTAISSTELNIKDTV